MEMGLAIAYNLMDYCPPFLSNKLYPGRFLALLLMLKTFSVGNYENLEFRQKNKYCSNVVILFEKQLYEKNSPSHEAT